MFFSLIYILTNRIIERINDEIKSLLCSNATQISKMKETTAAPLSIHFYIMCNLLFLVNQLSGTYEKSPVTMISYFIDVQLTLIKIAESVTLKLSIKHKKLEKLVKTFKRLDIKMFNL